MKINLLSLLMALAIIFVSCKKYENPDLKVETPATQQLKTDEAGIAGTIYDNSGYPSAGTEVIVDGTKVITDTNGDFYFAGKVSNVDKVIVRVAKAGYFSYSKTLVVENNAIQGGLKIYLREATVAGIYNAASGGTVRNSYAVLNFEKNSVIKEDGSTYTGIVYVKMPLLSLQEPFNKYPGDGRALSATGEKVVIDPWGGFNIGLNGEAGEVLKLSKPMNYSFDMGGNYVYAPATMKLYQFNDAEGNWLETGTANRNGKLLEGTTTNLTYLAWAVPYEPALLRAYVADKNLNLATNFLFRNFTAPFGGGEQSANVNSKGVALLYIPANRTRKAAIFTPCGDRLNLWTVPPVATNTKATQNYQVDLTPYLTTLNGTVEDCNFAAVNGRAEFVLEGVKYNSEVKNGAYLFNLISCTRNYGKLTVYNNENTLIYAKDNVLLSNGYANKIPPVSTCSLPQNANVSFTVDGTTYLYKSSQDKIVFQNVFDNGQMITTISGTNAANTQSFYITYRAESAGTFSLYTLAVSAPGKNYLMAWGTYSPGIITVTKYKKDNTLIEGSLKSLVSLNNNFNSSTQITGTFSITR